MSFLLQAKKCNSDLLACTCVDADSFRLVINSESNLSVGCCGGFHVGAFSTRGIVEV